jgi:hypothetical protein
MNTITNTASTNTILGIDLGKYKSVACIHHQATGEPAFTTFETTRAELRKMICKEAWKFKHLKRKTDKDDALRLAQSGVQPPVLRRDRPAD